MLILKQVKFLIRLIKIKKGMVYVAKVDFENKGLDEANEDFSSKKKKINYFYYNMVVDDYNLIKDVQTTNVTDTNMKINVKSNLTIL